MPQALDTIFLRSRVVLDRCNRRAGIAERGTKMTNRCRFIADLSGGSSHKK
jgi:hypothetical protein